MILSLKNRKKFLENVKFDFQVYFNMEITLNCLIGILNLRMKDII
jgi:hypothetical protein